MQTFKKEERLTSKKLIEELLKNGSSFVEFPFRLIWMETSLQSSSPVQIVITVSKKHFPKAVDRNKIKRQMREAYRKNKEIIYSYLRNKQQQNTIMLVYINKVSCGYKEMEDKIILTLQRYREENEKSAK